MTKLTNILKRITIVFTLLTLLVPTTLTLINVNAQEADENKIIQLEITKKDGSTETKTTTTDELTLNPIVELPQEELPQLKLTPTQIKELETSQAIIYDENDFASLNLTVLKDLGYSQSEIKELEKMADTYNSMPVKEMKTTVQTSSSRNYYGVKVQAACEEYENKITYHLTHVEIFLNHCIIEALAFGSLSTGSLMTILGIALTPLGQLVAGYLAIQLGGLVYNNNICGGKGANINVPYVGSTLVWSSSIC